MRVTVTTSPFIVIKLNLRGRRIVVGIAVSYKLITTGPLSPPLTGSVGFPHPRSSREFAATAASAVLRQLCWSLTAV
jgi:hypothetical protein